MLITTDGIVIRERSVGENDKFIEILTGDLGVVEVSVKGVKKITAKNSSSTQLFSYSKFCLLKKGNRYILNSSEPIRSFYELRLELERLSLASYFSEIIRFSVLSEEPSISVLRLFLNTLHYLSSGERSCAFLKSVFELRFLCEIGLMPNLIGCKSCSCYENDDMYFLTGEGILLCSSCMHIETSSVYKVSKTVLYTLRYIALSDFEKLFSFRVGDNILKELNKITEDYLICQLNRSFKTLEFYKSITG